MCSKAITSRYDMMIEESNGVDSVFMEFINIKNSEGVIFCFFEGEDDFHYYKRHIEKFIGDNEELYDKCCGGKDNVLSLYKRIKESTKLKRKILYFIDRDFEKHEDLNYDADIFVTRAYSIENYYITNKAFESFLNLYLKLNKRCMNEDKCDYDNAFSYYVRERDKFIDETLTINAWYSIQKKYKDVKLNQIKKLPKKRMNNIDELKRIVPNAKDVSLEIIENEKEYLKKDALMNFRGKYFLEFLHKILMRIKQYTNESDNLFTKKRKFSLHFKEEDLIKIFSNCSEIDCGLENYLKKNLCEAEKEAALFKS